MYVLETQVLDAPPLTVEAKAPAVAADGAPLPVNLPVTAPARVGLVDGVAAFERRQLAGVKTKGAAVERLRRYGC